MFSKKPKAYSVYLFFRFCFSLLLSMATVLSMVYHLEVVGLGPFQLVLVGTVLETSCFLFEVPTGVVADLYSRRRSVLIGIFLYGAGFLMEGSLPWFGTVLLAQVVWGCGDTFLTGALEAWIASEEGGRPMDKVFLRGGQLAQTGGILGVIIGTLLGNLNLQLPIILAGALCLVLGIVLLRVMPEEHFSPALEDRQGLLNDFINLFRLNLRFVKGAPVLLALLLITFCGGLASEGFDRLSTAHFLNDTAMPTFGPLNSVTWFGFMSLLGSGLGIFASGVLHCPNGKAEQRQPHGSRAVHQRRVYRVPATVRLWREFLVPAPDIPAGWADAYPQRAGARRLDERSRGGADARHYVLRQRPAGLFRADHRRAYRGPSGPAGLRSLWAGLHSPPATTRPVSGAGSGKGQQNKSKINRIFEKSWCALEAYRLSFLPSS